MILDFSNSRSARKKYLVVATQLIVFVIVARTKKRSFQIRCLKPTFGVMASAPYLSTVLPDELWKARKVAAVTTAPTFVP